MLLVMSHKFSSSRPIPASFTFSAFNISDLPCDSCSEIAFLGRSNCGKSSLLNSICGRKSLAYVSRSPGRTNCLNFYQVSNKLRLVDMPGYGYAVHSKGIRSKWSAFITEYLMHRQNLLYLFLLLDGRRLAMKIDLEILALLKNTAVRTYIICTKTDLINKDAFSLAPSLLASSLLDYEVILQETFFSSSKKGLGIDKLRSLIRLSM